MENQLRLNVPGPDSGTQRDGRASPLPVRPRYLEVELSEGTDRPGSDQLAEFWRILRRRKRTLVLAVFLGLLSSFLITLLQVPLYQARASLEIQNLNENFLNMRDVNPTTNEDRSYTPDYELQTQVQLLQSESVLEAVIAKLGLQKRLPSQISASRLSAWRNAVGFPKSQPLSREVTLRLIKNNLNIITSPNTRLVEILYDSADPQLSADFVNTLTTEFIQQSVEARWKTTQQTGEWLTHEIEGTRVKLAESEHELQSYAQDSGLLFTSEKDNVTEEKLRQLQEELSKAQADRIAKQSKYELVSTAPPESLPEVLDDATLKEYEVRLTDLRRQLAELSSSLTATHPAVKKVQAQVATLESALEKERANVIERVHNEFETAHRRENLLAASYASQARLMSEQAAKVTDYNILKREVDTRSQLYSSLLHDLQEASMTSALRASNIRVVDPAKPPTHRHKPNLPLNLVFGLLAGGFLGIAIAVIRERGDHFIHTPGEAAFYLDVPELGAIPSAMAVRKKAVNYYDAGKYLEGKKSEDSNPLHVELVTANKNPSVLADAFRATLTSILFCEENGSRPRVIVVTSPNPGEGKTTVAVNLALALAEVGQSLLMQSVLLIDGDLRSPRLHEILGVPNRWGLADLLAGKRPQNGCEGMVFKTGFKNLSLLPSGLWTSNIPGLLHSPRALALLSRMREEFDTVIIDTPPMLHVPDARILGHISDGVILVVRSALTMREAAATASRRLIEDGTRVLGTVLNQWDPQETVNYSYTYNYHRHEANHEQSADLSHASRILDVVGIHRRQNGG